MVRPFQIVLGTLSDLRDGKPRSRIAAKFHRTVADIILQVCSRLRDELGLTEVCLSGGVFQNVLLLREAVQLLRSANFRVFFPQNLPANDGGLSLGQAVIALAGLDEIGME